jgi:hypothetical protein
MSTSSRKKARYTVKVTRDMVAPAIGAELRKRFARMSDAQLGHLFLFLSTGRR